MPFRDRTDAGRQLADRLVHVGDNPVVLGLPRGGVPVAAEVARQLGAPLDVILVRKLGVPYQPELAMGAVGEGGVRVLNQEVLDLAGVRSDALASVEARAKEEITRRALRLRGSRHPIPLAGRTAIVVDDGIATGSTAEAACLVARAHGAACVILAVPVAPPASVARLRSIADEVICLEMPEHMLAIGQWYDDFSQTTDEEVAELLQRWADGDVQPAEPRGTSAEPDHEVSVRAGRVALAGLLDVPPLARAVVVFVHGSGSSRHSPRNQLVARVLREAGLATLLFDLLSPDEEQDRANVFDVGLLAERLIEVTGWVRRHSRLEGLPVCYFGASTGAAAALCAAAEPGADIAAVVSRGGRPDLATTRLPAVRAPTLLIVGSRDEVVLELNRAALAALRCESRLVVVEGATHLFEEPGTLDAAAGLARDWFLTHLPPQAPDRPRADGGTIES
ncbi:MAG TPA: alpha/beta family hydrolase [Acidimicrobiales bacterium]|nr:alpha/beta family hydrolase [Acidimicrobiales bacterium]